MFMFMLYDVGHGFCAYLRAPNGATALFDCGYDAKNAFHPVDHMKAAGVSRVNQIFLSHFDQDHVCDLPLVMSTFGADMLARNRTVPPNVIRSMKAEGGVVTQSMERALAMHETWVLPAPTVDFAGVTFTSFNNSYPEFTDSNNLSLVTFIDYDGLTILVPGDLETTGWEKLMMNDAFTQKLRDVNVFVASHHGRNEGYCEEVFRYCKPTVIILSDKNIVHASQEHAYRKHSLGIPMDDGGTRYVFTTRCDGHIKITKEQGLGWRLTYNAD
jgi:beta-lactamase superfamily II metal-dependent hydrolase